MHGVALECRKRNCEEAAMARLLDFSEMLARNVERESREQQRKATPVLNRSEEA